MSSAPLPLAGVRIVEISSFVAVPLAGMTLAALGADVVRVDPIGGAADYHRWPLTDDGESIYWAGLNRGKRSMAVDTRGPQGQQQVQRLIAEAGVLITNVTGRQWHSPSLLGAMRPDLIHLEVVGRQPHLLVHIRGQFRDVGLFEIAADGIPLSVNLDRDDPAVAHPSVPPR